MMWAFAVEANERNFDRLEAKMATVVIQERPFIIARVFDAPRDLVWQAWTQSQRLMHWWGPKGFTVRVCNVDLRPGGVFHYCLRMPNGGDLWGRFVYREITAPGRLVFLNTFSDEAGNVTRNPWAPDWPLELLNTLALDELEGRTAFRLHSIPFHASQSERGAFEAGNSSLRQGWTGTLEQLAAYLAKA